MQKKGSQGVMSPGFKPGLFSKHCELNKFNKQKSFKVEETLTPKLFESKEIAPQPKLQKSQSACRLLIPKETKEQPQPTPPKIQSRQEQITELSQKLLRELIEFNESAELGGANEIQSWTDEMINKLILVKNSLENQDNFDSLENISEAQQNEQIQNLQKELNDERKERYRIEEEATNLITEQELEIDRLEKQLKQLEEKHSQ